ncbi:MAG: citrate synthase, partial [Candidatus Methanomethylophilaceae archaeon]|nr:citrate synthase [Candidatus Methanomethylophilaceae archaeon]
EAAYLLLFGNLPSAEQTEKFRRILAGYMELPGSFVKDVIFREYGHDIMNTMARGVLGLSSYDDRASDNSLENVIRQCLSVISRFSMLAVYGYHSYNHYDRNGHLVIFRPNPDLGIAENIMSMLRPDREASRLEKEVLDIMLTLHMEHGGGNNSAFTARVVASSGSDSYSVIAAAILSLKGPKHGGANIKVLDMVNDIKAHVEDTDDREEVSSYLKKIVDGEAFDGQGLIYGMGHAVYTLSDPRAIILRKYAESLAKEKGREKDMRLFESIEELAPDIIRSRRQSATHICANVDLYSGFLYNMLEIPSELFTPMFAIARVVGWSAHRIEELVSSGKIIRPKYVSIAEEREYIPSGERSGQNAGDGGCCGFGGWS